MADTQLRLIRNTLTHQLILIQAECVLNDRDRGLASSQTIFKFTIYKFKSMFYKALIISQSQYSYIL